MLKGAERIVVLVFIDHLKWLDFFAGNSMCTRRHPIDLAANQLVNLVPLGDLGALRWLDLSDNRIEGLTPPAQLVQLQNYGCGETG